MKFNRDRLFFGLLAGFCVATILGLLFRIAVLEVIATILAIPVLILGIIILMSRRQQR